ncbi:MAG TPA: apolipoprotein N-acyltransferase, partial [Urbifossiella sp.]
DWAEVSANPGSPPSDDFKKEVLIARHFFGDIDLRKDYSQWKIAKPDWKVTTLFGLNGLEWEGGKEWRYNSALLVTPDAVKRGRYDKMHLVPFGEYVPFKETLPWLQAFTPYENDYSCRPGEHWTRFPLTTHDGKHFTFGCLICYEDSDPYLARHYVASDPVNFFVNISNDGWFKGTEEHEQHLAICRFRAVEARRSIVRAVNMGISCVIDSDGRVVALPKESWSASKKVEGIVAADMPIDHRGSCYAAWGDWLPAICWCSLVVGHGFSMIRKRRATP